MVSSISQDIVGKKGHFEIIDGISTQVVFPRSQFVSLNNFLDNSSPRAVHCDNPTGSANRLPSQGNERPSEAGIAGNGVAAIELSSMAPEATSSLAPPSGHDGHVAGQTAVFGQSIPTDTLGDACQPIGSPIATSTQKEIHLPSALCTPKEDNNLTIVFRDVSHSVLVPQHNGEISTFISPIANIVKGIATCGAAFKKREFYRCRNISGVVKPGTMTLVLSPPGHGKSTYLRMLAHRVEAQTGHLLYNGRTFDEAAQEGIDVRKMIQYVDQVDTHLPLLTVTETLDFAHKMSSVQYNPDRVEAVINMLGLEECRDTILGDALTRGVSGGQRKRVSIGEMLVSDACTLLLDEFTNGLDTATSEDIGRVLRQWCIQTNGSIVATLQQPTPGMFELFDRVVVLREGSIVYDGPQVDMLPYFDAMGFKCPDDVDVCDFIIDCLSQPRLAVMRQREQELYRKQRSHGMQGSPELSTSHTHNSGIRHGHQHSLNAATSLDSSTINTTYGFLQKSQTACITTEEMVEFYHTTPLWEELRVMIDGVTQGHSGSNTSRQSLCGPLAPTALAKTKFKSGLRLPFHQVLAYVISRQGKVLYRNKGHIIPRVVTAIIMSLVFGSIYWDVDEDAFFLRVASLLVCLSKVGFGNMSELPISLAGTRVVLKQLASNFYPSWAFVVGSLLVSFPIIVGESLLFSVILYWMCGCAPYALEFFIYFFIILAQSIYLATWFRLVASFAANEAQAQALAGPSTGIFMIFGGFFVTEPAIPRFMVWVFWISPFSWATRALANNEFLSNRYDGMITVDGETVRKGDVYLQQLAMLTGVEWIVYGVVFLIGISCVFMALQSVCLRRKWYEESIGTRRNDEEEMIDSDLDMIQAAAANSLEHPNDYQAQQDLNYRQQDDVELSVSQSQSSIGSSKVNASALRTLREKLPFSPTWLSFSNIRYTVKVKKGKEMVDRVLLDGVTGYAEPGKLTALMGASGAGKTTLLDVLAGRKNVGAMEGKVLINSQHATPEQFAAVAGYVEQFDTLFSCSTVRETLLFAAQLRLPSSVDDLTKHKIVDEVLDILDLTSIKHFLIGDEQIQGLSPSQLKRVNIGVELVANPAILFLDEPTTGLDSKSAQTVMRVVRRIARSGRSVICTIHQPSAELFYLFDRLVLLGSGGHQIYFGDLGRRSKIFIQYLSAIPGVNPIAPRYNPASWMLEELGVGVASMKESHHDDLLSENEVKDESGNAASAELTSQQRLVQQFKQVYFASDVYHSIQHRVDYLEALPLTVSLNSPVVPVASDKDLVGLPTEITPLPKSNSAHFSSQLRLLYARNFMGHYRNPPFIFSRLFSATFISLLFGLVYMDAPTSNQSKVVGKIAAIGMAPLFGAIIHGGSSLPVFLANRDVFYRERSSGFYNPILWPMVSLGIEVFWCLIGAILLQLPCYWLVGMKADAGIYFGYLLAVYLFCLIFISTSMLWTSLASSGAGANVMNGAFLNTLTVFTGVSVPLHSIPRGWFWLFRTMPSSHFTEAVTMPQFEGNTKVIEVFVDASSRSVTVEDYVVEYLGYTYGHYWTHIGWLVLFFGVVQVLAYTANYFLIYNKR